MLDSVSKKKERKKRNEKMEDLVFFWGVGGWCCFLVFIPEVQVISQEISLHMRALRVGKDTVQRKLGPTFLAL